MSGDDLRDAIEEAVTSAHLSGCTVSSPRDAATYVLAMPEMQALLAKDAEIERLRAALANAAKSIINRERENDELHEDLILMLQRAGRLRAAGDALAHVMTQVASDEDWSKALREWEARRER